MFSVNDKTAKEAAIQKLMDLLDQNELEDMKSLKDKPAAEMTVTEVKPGDDEDDDKESAAPSDFQKAWAEMKGHSEEPALDDQDDDESELSDEEKQRISDLYHKHVAARS